MTRLIVVAEGQTEEAFVKEVLAPHLDPLGVYTRATIVGKLVTERRGHASRGGGAFSHWLKDIRRILGTDRSADLRVTTLFDLYGLPNDFPGLASHGADRDTSRRCDALEEALRLDVGDHRFLPYLQRHEFEALVLASLAALRGLLDARDDLIGLTTLEGQVGDTPPEDVNDGPNTAPSKRLLQHLGGYSKTLHGPLALADTGLVRLRERCPRFDTWIRKLEAYAGGPS